ncbi:MAG: DUF1080 domain-containing protein, partial [Candidatus Marinimicrobia bacterium]|nr:DUF1080 domain-containing protein [Candidatus Neomarinimicrobiota bacterium]
HGDQWVKIEVEVRGSTGIKHKVNGEIVLEYTEPQLDENDPDAKKLARDDKILNSGYIAFQAESHPVEFRNIKILILSK